MAKVTLDNFDREVAKILNDYGDEISQNIDIITQKIGQKGAKLLREQSKGSFGGTGKYASGWTAKTEKGRLYTTVTIYNRTPGLPHLLEHGHAVVAGGRVAGHYSGKTHIAPVETKLVQEYKREVTEKL